jgi:hypothetical protein
LESLRHENRNLYQIFETVTINGLCLWCLKGFSRTDPLYRQFHAVKDEIYPGPDPMANGLKRPHFCYQKAMKTWIAAKGLASLLEEESASQSLYVSALWQRPAKHVLWDGLPRS